MIFCLKVPVRTCFETLSESRRICCNHVVFFVFNVMPLKNRNLYEIIEMNWYIIIDSYPFLYCSKVTLPLPDITLVLSSDSSMD